MDRPIEKKNALAKALKKIGAVLEGLLEMLGGKIEKLIGKEAGKAPTGQRLSSMDRVVVKTPWEKYRKFILSGGGLIAFIILILVFMPEGGRALKVDNDRIVVSKVIEGEFDDFIPVRGQVAPLRTVFLDAIEGGRVEAIHIEDGASVVPGQMIVELSNITLQLDIIGREAAISEQINNLRNTELALEQNRLEHKRNLVDINYNIKRLSREIERQRPLVEKGTTSKMVFEQMQDEYDYYLARQAVTLESQETDERIQLVQMEQLRTTGAQLEKNLEVASRNLDALNVTAPVEGRLTAFNLEVGQSLNRGDRIGQIDDPDNFKITANIDEFYLGRVDIEQVGVFTLGGDEYTLRINKVYPQVTNGTFAVDMVFTGDQPDNVRRGQTVQLNLQLGDPTPSLMIPNGAFYQDTGGNWVFVVAPDGSKAVKRSVRLGRRNVRFIEVVDGLEPGEMVITSPYTNYLDMDRLELQSGG